MPPLHDRATARAQPPPGPRARRAADQGVFVATFAVFWLVSLVRVAGALIRHEMFGGESTLAVIVVAAVPWLLWAGPRASWGSRSHRR